MSPAMTCPRCKRPVPVPARRGNDGKVVDGWLMKAQGVQALNPDPMFGAGSIAMIKHKTCAQYFWVSDIEAKELTR